MVQVRVDFVDNVFVHLNIDLEVLQISVWLHLDQLIVHLIHHVFHHDEVVILHRVQVKQRIVLVKLLHVIPKALVDILEPIVQQLLIAHQYLTLLLPVLIEDFLEVVYVVLELLLETLSVFSNQFLHCRVGLLELQPLKS